MLPFILEKVYPTALVGLFVQHVQASLDRIKRAAVDATPVEEFESSSYYWRRKARKTSTGKRRRKTTGYDYILAPLKYGAKETMTWRKYYPGGADIKGSGSIKENWDTFVDRAEVGEKQEMVIGALINTHPGANALVYGAPQRRSIAPKYVNRGGVPEVLMFLYSRGGKKAWQFVNEVPDAAPGRKDENLFMKIQQVVWDTMGEESGWKEMVQQSWEETVRLRANPLGQGET